MILFALAFLAVYTLMHLWVWWGVRPLLPRGRGPRRALLLWTAAMIAAPLMVRLLERWEFDLAARLAAWLGYLWLGFVWLAFAFFTAQGAWNGVMRLAARLRPAAAGWQLRGARAASFTLAATLIAGGWAVFEARALRSEEIRLAVPALPEGRRSLRIVQISDLHLGLINRHDLLEEVISRTRALRPDLVAVTGDLLDAQRNHLEELIEPWRGLEPPLGKFAVVGNHEHYIGRETALDYLQRAGFLVLRDETVTVGGVRVAGALDPAWGRRRSDAQLLADDAPAALTLFLKHRPQVEGEAVGRFTLQLSGHTHRGQIFPFNLVTALAYPLQDGLHLLAPGCWLYTSRGTGTWGPPMRLLSPPEITLIELRSN